MHYLCGDMTRLSITAKEIGAAVIAAAMLSVTVLSQTACNPLEDVVETSRLSIIKHLEGQKIYDRNVNVNELPPNTEIEGNYDVIDGAYRYILDEKRPERRDLPEIRLGDSISFMFDMRIFASGWERETYPSYFSNIPERIPSNNSGSGALQWSTEPMRIKIGDDPRLLKALHNVLLSCRAVGQRQAEDNEGNPMIDEDGNPVMEKVASDMVRVFLPPNVGYGIKGNGVVPGKSTLVWILTDIRIIDNTTL
jgi:hypothetical protein